MNGSRAYKAFIILLIRNVNLIFFLGKTKVLAEKQIFEVLAAHC